MGFFDKLKPSKDITSALKKAKPAAIISDKILSGKNVLAGSKFEKVGAAGGKLGTVALDVISKGKFSESSKNVTSGYKDAKKAGVEIKGGIDSARSTLAPLAEKVPGFQTGAEKDSAGKRNKTKKGENSAQRVAQGAMRSDEGDLSSSQPANRKSFIEQLLALLFGSN